MKYNQTDATDYRSQISHLRPHRHPLRNSSISWQSSCGSHVPCNICGEHERQINSITASWPTRDPIQRRPHAQSVKQCNHIIIFFTLKHSVHCDFPWSDRLNRRVKATQDNNQTSLKIYFHNSMPLLCIELQRGACRCLLPEP